MPLTKLRLVLTAKSSRFFKAEINKDNLRARIDRALSSNTTPDAKTAYYKGLGFLRIGQYATDVALCYFEKAVLDPKFKQRALKQITFIHKNSETYQTPAAIAGTKNPILSALFKKNKSILNFTDTDLSKQKKAWLYSAYNRGIMLPINKEPIDETDMDSLRRRYVTVY